MVLAFNAAMRIQPFQASNTSNMCSHLKHYVQAKHGTLMRQQQSRLRPIKEYQHSTVSSWLLAASTTLVAVHAKKTILKDLWCNIILNQTWHLLLCILPSTYNTLHTNCWPTASYNTDITVVSLFNSETTCFLHCTRKFLQKFFVSLIWRNINAIETETQYQQITTFHKSDSIRQSHYYNHYQLTGANS